jgi:hypothetical protein
MHDETVGMVNVVISHELKFVYLGIPRTANRATHWALMGLPGAIRHGFLHEMGIPTECREYFTFCCIRNPYQRFLSWYRWRAQPHPWGSEAKNMSFHQYIEGVENGQLGPSTLRGFTENSRLDHVYRFEDLPRSLNSIREVKGIESVKLAKCGQKLSRHWRQFYDQELADRVYNICKADFDDFEYNRNSWRVNS